MEGKHSSENKCKKDKVSRYICLLGKHGVEEWQDPK
jgi:hypothetical protein